MLNIRLNYKTQRWKFDDAVDEFSLKAFCREENIVLFNEVKLYELPVSQKIRTICSKNWTILNLYSKKYKALSLNCNL